MYPETLTKINSNSTKITDFLKSILCQISEISKLVSSNNQEIINSRIKELQLKNEILEQEVINYKEELAKLRKERYIPLVPIMLTEGSEKTVEVNTSNISSDDNVCKTTCIQAEVKSKPLQKTNNEKDDIHFGRLDIRVGKIISAEKHPDADSLYVEKVDVGDENPRTVISGLVKFIPLEQMQGQIALFLCNLKPVKMRGILSEGMIMCTSNGDKCEILEPPAGCKPGDVVTVEGYPRNPDPIMNPKKKIFETVAAFLKVNDHKEATYKNISWNVAGKGPALSKTLTNTIIK